MGCTRTVRFVGFFLLLMFVPQVQAQQFAHQPMPGIPELMREVRDHQKQLDAIRENYTFSRLWTIQQIDSKGQVKKTETEEYEAFFANGHQIECMVKKEGHPLSDHDQQKETEHVTKLVEKAEKTSPDQPLEGQRLSISRMLEIMDVSNPRREIYRGRSTFVFDFSGRKNVKTHGLAEDFSKKIQGTMWVDEAGRTVAHLEVSFKDNFHVGGGLLASIGKGSNLRFDQAPVNGEIWLPIGSEGTMQVRLLMVMGLRMHFTERDFDYKRFRVETQQGKNTKTVSEKKQ